MLLLGVLGALVLLVLTKLLVFKIQTGVFNMNKTNLLIDLLACVAETFYAIGCSVVANFLPA